MDMQLLVAKLFPFAFNFACVVQIWLDKYALWISILLTDLYILITHIQAHLVYNPPAVLRPALSNSKYCYQCDLLVPRQSRHCDKSGYCVERYDHFCWFFGVEIGKCNIRYYLAIQILEMTFLVCSAVIFCAHISFKHFSYGNFILGIASFVIFAAIANTAFLVRAPMRFGLTQWEAKQFKHGHLDYDVLKPRTYFEELRNRYQAK